MNKLNDNLFAFTAWLVRNRHVETEAKLRIIDGYEWYDYMWGKWLQNSDAGARIQNGEETIMGNNNPDNTVTENMSKQNNTGKYPVPGQIWKHYKGGQYEIIAMCNHTDTDESLVIYRSLSFGGYHARPYNEWHDEVWVDNHCKIRFELFKW